MILISSKIIKITIWTVKYAYFLKVIPFIWKKDTLTLVMTPSKFGYIAWCFVCIYFQIHQIFMFLRLWESVVAQNRSFTYYIAQGAYAFGFLVPTICQCLLVYKGDGAVSFYNRYTSYYLRLDCKLKIYNFRLYGCAN